MFVVLRWVSNTPELGFPVGVLDVPFALLLFRPMGWGSGDAGLEEAMWLAYPRGAAAAEDR